MPTSQEPCRDILSKAEKSAVGPGPVDVIDGFPFSQTGSAFSGNVARLSSDLLHSSLVAILNFGQMAVIGIYCLRSHLLADGWKVQGENLNQANLLIPRLHEGF